MTDGYSLAYGARFLKRVIETRIKLPISQRWTEGDEYTADVRDGTRRDRGDQARTAAIPNSRLSPEDSLALNSCHSKAACSRAAFTFSAAIRLLASALSLLAPFAQAVPLLDGVDHRANRFRRNPPTRKRPA